MSRRQRCAGSQVQVKLAGKLEKRLAELKTERESLPPLCSCMTRDREEISDMIYDWMVKKLIHEQETGVQAAMVPPFGYEKLALDSKSAPVPEGTDAEM